MTRAESTSPTCTAEDGIRKDGTPVDVTVLQNTTIRFSNGGKALVTGVESQVIKAAGEL